jgi:hypothetical protein
VRRFFKIGYRLGFAATLILAPSLFAQTDHSQADEQTAKPPANINTTHQILVTGCLKRGNQPGTYVITDQNGTTWQLVSGNADVDLSKHIFHAVSVAGKEVPTSPQSDSRKQSPQANNPLHELRVLTLQVLSPSCTR